MAAMNAHNSDGSIIEGASSVFVDALRMGLCALWNDAVLFRIPPRNSRAMDPAIDVCAFRKLTRRLPARPNDGSVAVRGGIVPAVAPAMAGARRTCRSDRLSCSTSSSSIYSHPPRNKARANIRAFKGQSRGFDAGMSLRT